MAVAAQPFYEKTDEQKAIIEMVRQFVDEQILPQAEHYDSADEFPEPIVEQMKELGLFGVTIPEEYGGMGLDLTTYAMIVEELSRGWISISGIVNTHFIGSYFLMKFGTEEQKQAFLPRMATGELRAAFSLSEPEVGSDVQGIKSTAKKLNDGLTVPPQIKKMGYKGVESTELVYDGYVSSGDRILGGEENGLGRGFAQM